MNIEEIKSEISSIVIEKLILEDPLSAEEHLFEGIKTKLFDAGKIGDFFVFPIVMDGNGAANIDIGLVKDDDLFFISLSVDPIPISVL